MLYVFHVLLFFNYKNLDMISNFFSKKNKELTILLVQK